jgi:acyl-CoA thioester hydrolase
MRDTPKTKKDFKHFYPITTRWMDNDAYGHVNNVVYYLWFDTVVNQFLISHGTLDIHEGAAIGLVIESHCNYFAPVTFPEPVTAGLCVSKLGNSVCAMKLVSSVVMKIKWRHKVILCMCMWID